MSGSALHVFQGGTCVLHRFSGFGSSLGTIRLVTGPGAWLQTVTLIVIRLDLKCASAVSDFRSLDLQLFRKKWSSKDTFQDLPKLSNK